MLRVIFHTGHIIFNKNVQLKNPKRHDALWRIVMCHDALWCTMKLQCERSSYNYTIDNFFVCHHVWCAMTLSVWMDPKIFFLLLKQFFYIHYILIITCVTHNMQFFIHYSLI
jgi:hypothetical protein